MELESLFPLTEIISGFWFGVCLQGVVFGFWFWAFFVFFYMLSPGAKRLRIHYPVQQNALHPPPPLGHLFKLLEADYQFPNNAVIKSLMFSCPCFIPVTKKIKKIKKKKKIRRGS